MIYKFMKKNNEGEWVLAETIDTYTNYSQYETTLQSYTRNTLDRHDYDTYYFKDDLNKIVINNMTRYSINYTQTEFDNMTQTELINLFAIVKCEICGRYESLDTAIKVGRNHYYCSENCAERVAIKCEICGEWYLQKLSIANNTNNLAFEKTICNKCFEKHKRNRMIRLCADCGKWDFYYDGAVVQNNFYCRTCKENHIIPQVLLGYHDSARDWQLLSGQNEDTTQPLLRFGHETEIETAEGADNNEVAYNLKKIHEDNGLHYYYERDSSLEGRGFEIISMPATLQWYYENAEKIKTWLQYLINNGCKSHDTTTCGLHIHISRNFFSNNDIIENRLRVLS